MNGIRTRRRTQGFLLMEAMIAIFVGTLVLISAISLVTAGAVAAEAARQNNIATNCARQILENVRLRRGAMLVNGPYTDATVFGPVPQLTELRGGSASLTISSWEYSVKSVVITVNWRAGEGGGKAKTRVISALVGPRGVTL
jgi:Tfp pilus assembly protein PilV